MATVISKTLSITQDNAKQYCTADGLSLEAGGHAFRKWLNGGTNGYATLNASGMALLFPSNTAHPFKADSSMRGSRSAGTMTADLQFAGAAVHSVSFTSTSMKTLTATGITNAAISASTAATAIRWHIYGNNTNNQRIETAVLTLYFNQYSCAANAVGDGIDSVAVSNTAPYDGDTVTFTANVKAGATWHGWYGDAACTQLVSTDQTYTTAAADLTLYANATAATGTGIYIKSGGAFAEAQTAYRKISGAWVNVTDAAVLKAEMKTGKYIMRKEG